MTIINSATRRGVMTGIIVSSLVIYVTSTESASLYPLLIIFWSIILCCLYIKSLQCTKVFEGRLSQREFWYGFLYLFIFLILGNYILPHPSYSGVVWFSFSAAVLFSLIIRRLHDLDRSGWWVTFFFIPPLNIGLFFYLFLVAGGVDDNRFGKTTAMRTFSIKGIYLSEWSSEVNKIASTKKEDIEPVVEAVTIRKEKEPKRPLGNFYKILITIILLSIILGGLFYWFQIRPASIKHDCSWVKDYIPAQPAVTQEEIDAKNLRNAEYCINNPVSPGSWDALNCTATLGVSGERPKEAIPASDYYRKASESEYKFCLHDKGL